jgi:hypothetical protein
MRNRFRREKSSLNKYKYPKKEIIRTGEKIRMPVFGAMIRPIKCGIASTFTTNNPRFSLYPPNGFPKKMKLYNKNGSPLNKAEIK